MNAPVLRARVAEGSLEPAECLLVAVEELDLELAEARGHPLAVEDGHRVVDDLGAVGPHALPARAQPRDPNELPAAQMGGEQPDELLRRPRRRAGLLELDPRGAARQLELPEPRSLLDPMPERDAAAREPQVGGVEVGRGERLRRQLAPERGQLEPLARDELQLSLDVLTHPARSLDADERGAAGRPPLLTGTRSE